MPADTEILLKNILNEAIELTGKDFATETTLEAIDAGKLEETTFTGRVGEVQDNPTSNTVLDRLKTIATNVSNGTMAVTNAIDSIAYDLNAASFSEITDISNDYILDSIELNFSTAESKTITVTTADGTKLWQDTNTSQNIQLNEITQAFNGGENITVAVTQFINPGTMDCVLRVIQGGGALTGNPVLGAGDNTVGRVKITNGTNVADVDSAANGLVRITTTHRTIHLGKHYTCEDYDDDVDTAPAKYWHFKAPDTSARIHLFVRAIFKAGGLIELYEEPTISDNGVAITAYNNNRNSANTTTLLIYKDPTVDADGNKRLLVNKVGAGKATGGAEDRDNEFILKQNTSYVVKCTSEANDNEITMTLEFYEI